MADIEKETFEELLEDPIYEETRPKSISIIHKISPGLAADVGQLILGGGELVYDDGSRRRSHHRQSHQERRAAARDAQEASGVRIRIARSVMNQLDFKEERKAFYPFVQAKPPAAECKGLGSFAMTVFDTAQTPLMSSDEETTLETLEMRIRSRYPKLFEPSPPIEVTGTDVFAAKSYRPFIVLTLAPGFVYDEQKLVRSIVAPELMLDEGYQLDHTPHVSIGRANKKESIPAILDALTPDVLPKYVQFKPADITVETPAYTN